MKIYKTDTAITTLYELMGDVTKINPMGFLEKPDIRAIVKGIGFNPTQTLRYAAYPSFLMWRCHVDQTENVAILPKPSEYDVLLSKSIHGISLLSEYQFVELDEICDAMFLKISSYEFPKENIYRDAFLICRILMVGGQLGFREESRNLFTYLSESSYLTSHSPDQSHHASDLFRQRVLVYVTLQKLQDEGDSIDTYEKLNEVFKPFIDNLYCNIALRQIANPDLIDGSTIVS